MDESGLLPLPKLLSHWGADPGRSHWVLGWARPPSKYSKVLWRGWGAPAGPTAFTIGSVHVKLKRATGYRQLIVIGGIPDVVNYVLHDITVGPKIPIVHALGIVSTRIV